MKTVEISAVVYLEDFKPEIPGTEIPCIHEVSGEYQWKPTIDVDTGVITNWIPGVKCSVYAKVVDQCMVTLHDGARTWKTPREEYVPDFMCPKSEGYGDYIIMDIDENGTIANWNPKQVDTWREDGLNDEYVIEVGAE